MVEVCSPFLVLRQRQRYGLIDPSTIILTVDDPQERLGSGGATLNALLVATEHLSARAGYSVCSFTLFCEKKSKPNNCLISTSWSILMFCMLHTF